MKYRFLHLLDFLLFRLWPRRERDVGLRDITGRPIWHRWEWYRAPADPANRGWSEKRYVWAAGARVPVSRIPTGGWRALYVEPLRTFNAATDSGADADAMARLVAHRAQCTERRMEVNLRLHGWPESAVERSWGEEVSLGEFGRLRYLYAKVRVA